MLHVSGTDEHVNDQSFHLKYAKRGKPKEVDSLPRTDPDSEVADWSSLATLDKSTLADSKWTTADCHSVFNPVSATYCQLTK